MRIQVGDSLEARLASVDERVELVGKEGDLLGYFEPRSHSAEAQSAAEACPFSAEELEELAKQTGGRPLAEILSDLRVR